MSERRGINATRWGVAIIAFELVALGAVKMGILAATVVSAASDTGAPEPTVERSFVSEGWSAGVPSLDAAGRMRLVVRDAFGQPVVHAATLTLPDGVIDELTSDEHGVLRSAGVYESVPEGAVLAVADGGSTPVITTLHLRAGPSLLIRPEGGTP